MSLNRSYFLPIAFCGFLFSPWAVQAVTPACAGYSGWNGQTNPPTDASGLANTNFPEGSSTTYWGMVLNSPTGSLVTVHGQYPFARFMSLELYTSDTLVDFIDDVNIAPDPGQNNPYVSGTTNGTFTASVVFGAKPAVPAPNTIYTGTLTKVTLAYRIYHGTDPNDPAAGATNPVIPDLWLDGTQLINCPVQPMLPADSTPWLRLDVSNWQGILPGPGQILPAKNPPTWNIQNPKSAHFFPNGADFYLSTILSRQYLHPNSKLNIFVLKFLAPTFPNTRAGEAVYEDRQVRFWSLCTDDPYTTNVNRCLPDDSSVQDPSGYVTFVVSDPGSKPSTASMTKFYGNWVAWGALDLPTDVVYDRSLKPWGIDSPVHYFNSLIYRQTIANASFTQSIQNISLLPPDQQQAAMGAYWPVSGYCTKVRFEALGTGCIGK